MRAMEEAMAWPREFGIGVVSVRRSTHSHGASYVLRQSSPVSGAVFSNASPAAAMAVVRGCWAPPVRSRRAGGKLGPYLLDMSPAVAGARKNPQGRRRGEKIPLGYRSTARAARPRSHRRARACAADRRLQGFGCRC